MTRAETIEAAFGVAKRLAQMVKGLYNKSAGDGPAGMRRGPREIHPQIGKRRRKQHERADLYPLWRAVLPGAHSGTGELGAGFDSLAFKGLQHGEALGTMAMEYAQTGYIRLFGYRSADGAVRRAGAPGDFEHHLRCGPRLVLSGLSGFADGRRRRPQAVSPDHRLSADRRCARPLLPSSGGGGDTPAVHRGGGQTVRRPSRPPLLGSLERAGADLRHMAGSQPGKHGLLLRAFGGAVYSVAETEVRQPGGPQPPLGQELPGVGGNRTAPLRRHLQRYGGLAGVLRGNPGGGTTYAGQGGASPRWRTQRHGSHRPHALFQLYEHRQRGISAGPGDGLVRQQRGKYALPGGDRHHRRQEQMGAQRGDSRRGGQHHGPAGDPFP